MADTKQTRKFNDTPILSGTLSRASATGGVYPADGAWAGATGEIHIVTDAKVPAPVLEGTATITAPSGDTLARYRWTGAIGSVAVGKYRYEIEVLFTDGTKLTWPNNKEKFKLEIVQELG